MTIPGNMGRSELDEADPAIGGAAQIDLTGLKCPLPALRVRKALRVLAREGLLVAIATDPLAAIDIPNAVREEGGRVEAVLREGTRLRFTIRNGPPRSGC